jgi:hypothetical protein
VPKLNPGAETLLANCLAHGRRQFVEVAPNFPDECRYVLQMLGQVYGVDAEAREHGFTPQQRLELHRQWSAPVMEELHAWLERQFAERRTEPNSGLGKAITYLLRHWRPLTLFLREAGAPLDNNIVERALKRAVLASQERIVLPHAERGRRGGSVHEPDPYLPVMRGQLVRVPDRVAAPRPRTGGESYRLDALELSGHAAARSTGGVISCVCLAEKDRLRPWLGDIMKCL